MLEHLAQGNVPQFKSTDFILLLVEVRIVLEKSDAKTSMLYRMVSDVGGVPAEPLNITDHVLLPWEKRCHALLETLAFLGVMSTEEKRRFVEDMGETIYASLTYYEKWIMAASNFLVDKGYITPDELAEKIREVRKRFESEP